jgi:hypothetical protein
MIDHTQSAIQVLGASVADSDHLDTDPDPIHHFDTAPVPAVWT